MNKVILHEVDSKNIYGTMNGGTINLSNITDNDRKMLMEKHHLQSLASYEITKEDKADIFKEHRKAFGADCGFDWHKMFMADQTTKDGSYFEITKDYVEANPDGWTDIPEDILVITHKVPGVVVGHPVADCPVVMMSDLKHGITAVGHCSAEMIDRRLPMMIADALTNGYHSKEEDIRIFVGACAGNDWTYDSMPNWAKDTSFWKDCIIEENGLFKIDLRKALKKQFDERGLSNNGTLFDLANTRIDQWHYSHSAHFKKPEKFGRHFEGAFYQDDSSEKGKSK